MTRKDWFIVQNSIIDRDDLDIYEKMCCVVLARYADKEEFDDLLTSDIIAIKMGVSSVVAKKAVFTLIEKGLINFEGKKAQNLEKEVEEEKIASILNQAQSENIIKSSEPEAKLTISEFKKRLSAINNVKNSDYEDSYETRNKNIVKIEEKIDSSEEKSKGFSFADLQFEDMFAEDEESTAYEAESMEALGADDSLEDSFEDSVDDLDEEFEKTLINDEWASELKKIEAIIEKENLNEESLYSSLSDEAKFHLGLLEPGSEDDKRTTSPEPLKDNLKKPSRKTLDDSYYSLVDEVYDILDEKINEREARIILSFANNDIDRIRDKYRIAKNSQMKDKIDFLINELQKKDSPRSNITQISEEEMERLPNTQINFANINKMKLYSKYTKK